MSSQRDTQLPTGVQISPVVVHADHRGSFAELLRETWHQSPVPVQWNLVRNNSGVLRGVHLHKVHWDYLFLVGGEMFFGLHDMRADSPTYRQSAMLHLTDEELKGVVVPPGVAHGFYCPRASVHLNAVSEYWDVADELGCRWNSKEFGFNWPSSDPVLSERDANAESYDSLARAISGTRW